MDISTGADPRSSRTPPEPDDDVVEPTPTVRYEVVISATGVVHDAEGNVVSQAPVEMRAILTEDEIRAQIEAMNKEKP